MPASAAMNPGAKTYNARFCEVEEAFADQAHAMKSMNGVTNITDQPIIITCPVIKMKGGKGSTTTYYRDGELLFESPKKDEMVIYRTRPYLGFAIAIPDELLISCTLYQVDQSSGTIVSASTTGGGRHSFMSFITIIPQGNWSNYSMECIIPPGESMRGYEFDEGDDQVFY